MLARLVWVFLWLIPSAWACSCLNEVSFCEALRTTEVVFLGTVTEAGEGPATLRVEEAFRGLEKPTRTMQVDTMAKSGCGLSLQVGERYVIYGRPVAGKAGLVYAGFCSNSFAVRGKERWLEAVRGAVGGGETRLLGTVRSRAATYGRVDPVAGVPVVAVGGGVKRESLTDANGEFEFPGVAAGKYELRVLSPQYVELPPPPKTGAARGCGYYELLVSPNGMIGGTVTGAGSQARPGVPVQVFAGERGEMDRAPLQEMQTDARGFYEFHGLPPGDYRIAVNGKRYEDEQPWRPTFAGAGWIHLGPGERRRGIDLRLGEARTAAKLQVELVYEDGAPALGAYASVQSAEGVERAQVNAEHRADQHRFEMGVYMGEVYRVAASQVKVSVGGLVTLGGPLETTTRFWEGRSETVAVTGREAHVRVVLRESRPSSGSR